MTTADRRKLNRDAGFSLLELLIAVIILAIIVIPLLNLFLSSNKLNIKSRQTLRATTAAQDIMEGLKAYNIEEVKAQFADPASGFYIMDSRLIKGDIEEAAALEKDGLGNPADGLYVFSLKELNMQGSKFDAKITVDGRGYMDLDPALVPCAGSSPSAASHIYSPAFFSGEKCTVCGVFKNDARHHDGIFNDASLADARSIDKKNGTFVESDKIREAVLTSVFTDSRMGAVFKDSALETDIKTRLKQTGVSDTDGKLDIAYQDLQLPKKPDGVSFKDSSRFFDHVSREIIIDLSESLEKDENGRNKVDMAVTEKYTFDLHYDPGPPEKGRVETSGYMGSKYWVEHMGCGSIATIAETEKDPTTGADVVVEKVNVNLFYYPLYGASVPDKITINNGSKAHLNLLIAKLRYEKEKDDPTNPGQTMPDTDDPEYLTDYQLKAAEQSYRAEIEINDTYGFDPDKFSLKTNLGLNLVGEKYLGGASLDLPTQFSVKNRSLDQLNIFTLDGVRSPLGKPGTSDEVTELIYDVEVSVYEDGAAAAGFPDDKRMVVIEGSMTN